MMKRLLYWPILATLIVQAGCLARLDKPRVPKTLNRDELSVLYSIPEFRGHYDSYKTALGASPVEARRLRDIMINRIRVDIEMNYREYESRLFFNRGETNLGGDFLELGLAFAGAVSKGERAKSVLASALSGMRGTRLSYDKNFFREKTIEIIVSQMQAARETVKNRILDKMTKLPADRYTFEEAWVDLAEFFYAGTLQGGVQALANEAGKAAVDAQAETRRLEFIRTATLEDVTTVEQITDSYELLKVKWSAVKNEPDKAKPFLEQAKAVLQEMRVDLTGTETGEQLFELLRQEIRKLIAQRERLPKLATAFRNAKILVTTKEN